MYHKILVIKPEHKWVVLEVQEDKGWARESLIAIRSYKAVARAIAEKIAKAKGLEVSVIDGT